MGYTDNGKTIMGICDNKKIKDKEFIKTYGDKTVFNYNCEENQSDFYVYRMTMTNEDGEIFEYPTWLIKQRCEEMYVKTVPIFEQFVFKGIDDLDNKVEKYYDGIDPIGLTHIREGVVIRIENRDSFKAFKHKNFNFKLLEGIIKDDGFLDIEEQESLK